MVPATESLKGQGFQVPADRCRPGMSSQALSMPLLSQVPLSTFHERPVTQFNEPPSNQGCPSQGIMS
jgi:hypothetical protein